MNIQAPRKQDELKGRWFTTVLTDVIIYAISQEIKSAQEAEIQNREEVGMDLDDEVPNLGTLIEQPALQMAGEHQHEQDDSQSPPKAKKPRSDASGNSTALPCSRQ